MCLWVYMKLHCEDQRDGGTLKRYWKSYQTGKIKTKDDYSVLRHNHHFKSLKPKEVRSSLEMCVNRKKHAPLSVRPPVNPEFQMQHVLKRITLCISIHVFLTAVLSCKCIICMCKCMAYIHVSQHGLGGQRTTFGSLFSPSTLGPRDQTQVVSLCNKHFYPQSHLPGPISIFLNPWWDFSLRRRIRM